MDGNRDFWAEARRLCGNTGYSTTVQGANTPEAIAQLFKDDFSALFNSVDGSSAGLDDVRQSLTDLCDNEAWQSFTVQDVHTAVMLLQPDKWDGDGKLCSSALLYGP